MNSENRPNTLYMTRFNDSCDELNTLQQSDVDNDDINDLRKELDYNLQLLRTCEVSITHNHESMTSRDTYVNDRKDSRLADFISDINELINEVTRKISQLGTIGDHAKEMHSLYTEEIADYTNQLKHGPKAITDELINEWNHMNLADVPVSDSVLERRKESIEKNIEGILKVITDRICKLKLEKTRKNKSLPYVPQNSIKYDVNGDLSANHELYFGLPYNDEIVPVYDSVLSVYEPLSKPPPTELSKYLNTEYVTDYTDVPPSMISHIDKSVYDNYLKDIKAAKDEIDMYNNRRKSLEEQLVKYISDNFEHTKIDLERETRKTIDTYKAKLKGKISAKTIMSHEMVISEQYQILARLNLFTENALRAAFDKTHNVQRNLQLYSTRILCANDVITRAQQGLSEYLDKCKRHEQLIRKEEFINDMLKKPHDIESVNVHCIEYLKDKLSDAFTELNEFYIESILDIFNITVQTKRDIIYNIIMNSTRNNFIVYFTSHLSNITDRLSEFINVMTQRFEQNVSSGNSFGNSVNSNIYEHAENMLKEMLESTITNHFTLLADHVTSIITTSANTFNKHITNESTTTVIRNATGVFLQIISDTLKKRLKESLDYSIIVLVKTITTKLNTPTEDFKSSFVRSLK